MKARILLAVFALSLGAQSTKVVEMEKSDSKLIKDAYDAAVAAQEALLKADAYIKRKYVGDKADALNVQYSEDFRFILKSTSGTGMVTVGSLTGRGRLEVDDQGNVRTPEPILASMPGFRSIDAEDLPAGGAILPLGEGTMTGHFFISGPPITTSGPLRRSANDPIYDPLRPGDLPTAKK